MTFNNTQKLLAGALALVFVAGMTSPAFAQIEPSCEFISGQMHKLDLGPGEIVQVGKQIECIDPATVTFGDFSECEEIGVTIVAAASGISPTENGFIQDITEDIENISLGSQPGHCVVPWTVLIDQQQVDVLFQEFWFNQPQVAGELLPLDSTALVLAGLQSMSVFMIPAVAGLAGAAVYLVKFRSRE